MGVDSWTPFATAAVFVVAASVIAVAGVRLARVADILAHRSGLGEAIMGAVFLGATTSLSGSVTSVTAALDGFADLAISNALGGIAAQTAFLAVVDLAYRKANLEHAAASQTTLFQCALLLGMLSLPLISMSTPAVTAFSVHPASLVIPITFVLGIRLIPGRSERPYGNRRRRARRVRGDAARKWTKHATVRPPRSGFGSLGSRLLSRLPATSLHGPACRSPSGQGGRRRASAACLPPSRRHCQNWSPQWPPSGAAPWCWR